MAIWRTAPVEQQPAITLLRWQIVQVVWDVAMLAAADGTDEASKRLELEAVRVDFSDPMRPCSRHFVGYGMENEEGRVSSPIVQFDATRLLGRTRSGRIYELVGPPGIDPDANYVLELWVRRFRVRECRDVTRAVVGASSWLAH